LVSPRLGFLVRRLLEHPSVQIDNGGSLRESFQLPAPALLFCPGDRPKLYAKALDRADVLVIDLEDAVAGADKAAARTAMLANPVDPDRTIVRINARDSAHYEADLQAVAATKYRVIMLPKTEDAAQVSALALWKVIPLCETPLGILNAQVIAAADNVLALMWGSEDLVASLGGRSSRDRAGRLRAIAAHARSVVLLAAKAYGRQAVDAVYPDFSDLDGLGREAADAAASGFDIKACIHPNQVAVVRACFRPTTEQLAWAQQVIAVMSSGGVASVNGQMIDAPVLQQARSIVAWQDRDEAPSGKRGDR
jgi:citrate lyase subunit beta / citryl-CoA lyase